LGSYNKQSFDPNHTNLEMLHLNAEKLKTQGGYSVQDRMIKSKRRSLENALWNSY
jgi:hypothetical protein